MQRIGGDHAFDSHFDAPVSNPLISFQFEAPKSMRYVALNGFRFLMYK